MSNHSAPSQASVQPLFSNLGLNQSITLRSLFRLAQLSRSLGLSVSFFADEGTLGEDFEAVAECRRLCPGPEVVVLVLADVVAVVDGGASSFFSEN